MKTQHILAAVSLLAIFAASLPCASAGCACSAMGNWEEKAQSFLNSDVPSLTSPVPAQTVQPAEDTPQSSGTGVAAAQPILRSDTFVKGDLLQSPKGVSSSDVVLYTGSQYGSGHIKGAVSVPSASFAYENGTLRPAPEISTALGSAGISSRDSVVVYGDDVGEAAIAILSLSYLGQEDVSILDGGLEGWTSSGLTTETAVASMAPVGYDFSVKPDLLANYSYVEGGVPQIVDARSFLEYGRDRIPGSVNIPVEEVMDGGRIKDGSSLAAVFARLERDRPIVVYSDDAGDASAVWLALQLQGFDSRYYTWSDWTARQEVSDASNGEVSNQGSVVQGKDKFMKLGRT